MEGDLQRCTVLGCLVADGRSLQVRDEERLAGAVEPRARLVVRKRTSGRDIFTGKGRYHVLLSCVLLRFAIRTFMTVTDGVVVDAWYIADLEYSGAGNDLEYSLEFESNVHCELNLEMYPFDSQLCSITASITNVLSQVVRYPSPAAQTHPTLPPHAEFIITPPTLR